MSKNNKPPHGKEPQSSVGALPMAPRAPSPPPPKTPTPKPPAGKK